MKEVIKTAKKIKELKIQGATNIAISALNSIYEYLNKTKKEREDILKDLYKIKEIFFNTRSTEPLMRNMIKRIIYFAERKDGKDFKDFLIQKISDSISLIEISKKKLVNFGARKIPNNSVIQTICHSSTVVEILKKAKDLGKEFRVIVTETRPLYQGRITARELSEYNIPVSFYVDSGMFYAMKKEDVDLVIMGCDAITSEGHAINKIGSKLLATIADIMDIPVYVAGISMKFDFETSLGKGEIIEERDWKEIWNYTNKYLRINNPAFELVDRELIDAFITEFGILSPSILPIKIIEEYPWMVSLNEIKSNQT